MRNENYLILRAITPPRDFNRLMALDLTSHPRVAFELKEEPAHMEKVSYGIYDADDLQLLPGSFQVKFVQSSFWSGALAFFLGGDFCYSLPILTEILQILEGSDELH